MKEKLFVDLVSVPIFGIASQWLAWWFKIPSILLLLLMGFLVGPVLGILVPDETFGDTLVPLVSLSVAIIVFEGGLGLKIKELKSTGKVLRNLVSIGNVISMVVTALGAYLILGLSFRISAILGAILVVTGPTVIQPLLRQIRLKKHLGSLLRWEAIVIDPIGAIQAVLIYEIAVISTSYESAFNSIVFLLSKTLLVGVVLGVLGAILIMVFLHRRWVPDFLQEAFTLVLMLGIYAASEVVQHESGLLTVALMGIVLANQKLVVVKHIISFKENLTVLILSSLFVILAARLELDQLISHFNWTSLLFLGVLIFVGRPLSVFASSIGSRLTFKERLFVSWMAPRGIVAAAIASLFAIRLDEMGMQDAYLLVDYAFLVIFFTVIIYGLTAYRAAKFLKVIQPKFEGVLIVGAHDWARSIAHALNEAKIAVILSDTNKFNVRIARSEGLNAIQSSVLSDRVHQEVEIGGIGRLIALTSSDGINYLGSKEFSSVFGRTSVHRLYPEDKSTVKSHMSIKDNEGRFLFGKGVTFSLLSARFTSGATVKAIELTEEMDFEEFLKRYPRALPMFYINEKHHLFVFSTSKIPVPSPGQTLIALMEDA